MTTITEALRAIVADVDAPGHTVRSVRPESIAAARKALETGGWTRCEDALPEPLPETLHDWRTESAWVLVRTADGEAHVAKHCVPHPDYGDDGIGAEWVQRGRDGWTLDNVVEWMVIE